MLENESITAGTIRQSTEEVGLVIKYTVIKKDDNSIVEDCFVLRPDRDMAALEALRTYAKTTNNKALAKDLESWIYKITGYVHFCDTCNQEFVTCEAKEVSFGNGFCHDNVIFCDSWRRK